MKFVKNSKDKNLLKNQKDPITYPYIDLLKLLNQNSQIFNSFKGVIVNCTYDLHNQILDKEPNLLFEEIENLLEPISVKLIKKIDQFIIQGEKQINELHLNYKDPNHNNKKLNNEQNIQNQVEEEEFEQICKDFWQENEHSLSLENMIKIFTINAMTIFPIIYDIYFEKMYLIDNIDVEYEQKIQEINQNQTLSQKQKQKERKQQEQIMNEKKKSAKSTIKKILLQNLNNNKTFTLALRKYIEFLFFIQKNLGNQINKTYLKPVILFLYTVYELEISYAVPYLQKKNQKGGTSKNKPKPKTQTENLQLENDVNLEQNNNINNSESQNQENNNNNQNQNGNESEIEEEFPDDIPELSKILSKKKSTKNFIRKSVRYSKTQMDIATTFEMLFTSIYGLLTKLQDSDFSQCHLKTFHVNQINLNIDKLNTFFKEISLDHASQYIPIVDKLQAIKTMAQTVAKQEVSSNLKQKEIYNDIDRSCPWSSSLKSIFLRFTPGEIVMYDLRVRFLNEAGLDWGGLKNEWLALLSTEVFHPDYGLFRLSPNKQSIQPSPLAFLIPDYITHFRMLGRLVAKAVIENWNLEVTFSKSFLKHILGKDLYISDLEDIDPELAKNLKFILENDMGDGEDLLQYFSYSTEIMGKMTEIELIPNGFNTLVTQKNKKQFVKAFCRAKMTEDVQSQTIAFKQGMTDIIPAQCLHYLSEVDLQRHLSGIPRFDESVLKQMKKYAKLEGYQTKDRNLIDFFECLEDFSETMRANFLFFLTGSFKINFEGFKQNPIRITKVQSKGLPVAHTCFNQIELPEYNDKNLMKERLTISILHGGGGGFHIV
ncbi:HECT-domain-containing protein [Pseudocohnilembus persalinus]|uniref:HECT-type E3 ubiquitin transferase n=1 Tax=Pseudocohnilembus persalinus TaxID=266149 RepID=A0A0V0R341_PSEPJ|nr:HECT-domain-containing protein [Pseudocohnilembus persalinus]|eukprot:KRX08891.1 HECT-domain-containing protein [Pseudocohnilembus persalinus]